MKNGNQIQISRKFIDSFVIINGSMQMQMVNYFNYKCFEVKIKYKNALTL